MIDIDFVKNGGSYLNSLISECINNGCSEITVNGNYEIEETVLLPSGFTVILDNCHLRMADGTFCQMFRNYGADKENVSDSDIHIKGVGKSILDGGNYNDLSERNCCKDGRPFIIVNNILTFVGVRNLSVSGLEIRNMRWWALNFIACSHGHIHDICFASDATAVDQETGERSFGLGGRRYDEIYIKNSDGIDLRLGCHDFLIENISGFTEDDTVALTALCGKTESYYPFPSDAEHSIHDVVIRNVHAAALCGIVRLLNQGGTSLYNITINGVFDTSGEDERLDRGERGVLIGDRHLYGEYYPAENETYNISVSDVKSRAGTALRVCGKIGNLSVNNIQGFDGCKNVIETVEQ